MGVGVVLVSLEFLAADPRTWATDLPQTRQVRNSGPNQARVSPDGLVALVLSLAAVSLFALYTPLNHGPARWIPKTPLDDAIPLIVPMVVPYLSIYPIGVLTSFALWRTSWRFVHTALIAVLVTLLASYTVYVVAQTYVERPSVGGADILSALLRGVYAGDQPYNAFPSLHVGLSTVIALQWLWSGRRFRVWVAAWCGVIALSTLFVHQHYLADLVSGVMVGGASSLASRRIVRAARRSVAVRQ
jgi:membrane-associated phospholipid phosphatase